MALSIRHSGEIFTIEALLLVDTDEQGRVVDDGDSTIIHLSVSPPIMLGDHEFEFFADITDFEPRVSTPSVSVFTTLVTHEYDFSSSSDVARYIREHISDLVEELDAIEKMVTAKFY